VLRRKLILTLGPLVLALVVTAIAASWMLQDVLRRLDTMTHATQVLPDPSSKASQALQLEHEKLTGEFRKMVIGLGIVFLFVINLSVVLLVRMATLVLRPVDQLLTGTRELCRENYAYRVQLTEHDEFDELAAAYNMLAEHLQSMDRRRFEVLGQVALALNHDLNNAMATMELQLGMIGRSAGDVPATERRLRTIQTSLVRMRDTVQSLKNIRRIVLTDYEPGVKMLDLQQSVREDQATQPCLPPSSPAPPAPPAPKEGARPVSVQIMAPVPGKVGASAKPQAAGAGAAGAAVATQTESRA
jgi:signal transduction histidine kinase